MMVFVVIVAVLVTIEGAHPALSWLTLGITLSVSTYWLLIRAGLLAYLVAMLSYNLLLFAPTGIDQNTWYTSMGMFSIMLVAGLGATGVWLALASKEATGSSVAL
jgi:hypothetical protein